MPGVIATVMDAVDGMVRRLGGQRLCTYCHQWAKNPHQSGGLYFCDKIHASIHFNKQNEAMKQALSKQPKAPQ
jgi:hypothetical protein